jgi:hypothetical protein
VFVGSKRNAVTLPKLMPVLALVQFAPPSVVLKTSKKVPA